MMDNVSNMKLFSDMIPYSDIFQTRVFHPSPLLHPDYAKDWITDLISRATLCPISLRK
jgi:hypothetical protein